MLNPEAIEAFNLPQLRYHLQKYNLPTTGGPKGGVKKYLQEKLKAHILSLTNTTQSSDTGEQEQNNTTPTRTEITLEDNLEDTSAVKMFKDIFNYYIVDWFQSPGCLRVKDEPLIPEVARENNDI